MSALMIVRTFFEILGILLAAYAIYRKDDVDAFEQRLFKVGRYYYHRHMRLKSCRKMQKKRAFVLAVDNTRRTPASNPDTVSSLAKAVG